MDIKIYISNSKKNYVHSLPSGPHKVSVIYLNTFASRCIEKCLQELRLIHAIDLSVFLWIGSILCINVLAKMVMKKVLIKYANWI